jgi:hypothetical protein
MSEVVARYMPQVQHYMHVIGVRHAVLSIFVGTTRWEQIEIEADPFYQAEMRDRLVMFWASVVGGEPPVQLPIVAAPVAVEKLISIDMTGNNEWAVMANDWLVSRHWKKRNEECEKSLKALVAPYVGLAVGYGVKIKRDGAGRLRLTPEGPQNDDE